MRDVPLTLSVHPLEARLVPSGGLVRVSAGVEDEKDLLEDFGRALT